MNLYSAYHFFKKTSNALVTLVETTILTCDKLTRSLNPVVYTTQSLLSDSTNEVTTHVKAVKKHKKE